MTYWPISSPSVFAATKHTNPERTRVSHDGVEHKQPNTPHGGPGASLQAGVEDEKSMQGGSGVEEKDGQTEPRSELDQVVEDDIHGQIIAVRVTRSGHMFATLTRSTLTIWQTKARLLFFQLIHR